MKGQVFNPYLPSWEYIPDGEPHVFDGRVYVYGSHDRINGGGFCMNDYVTWSAPADDLSDWRYEGVIYKKSDDPAYKGRGSMYAPDVCRAPDGKYYLYYAFAPGITRKSWAIRCAVSDSPAGPFTYHGEVDLYPYSKQYLPFDPAVYVEDGRVWLYYGSAMFFPVLGVSKKGVKGGAVVELDPADMLTVKAGPVTTVPTDLPGGHGFFEASSMRKIGGRYYFVYSSALGHELCYALGDSPAGPFTFGGTLVSNGDIGLRAEHADPATAANYTGNTHGGMLSLNGKNYIFYHRHTDRDCFSRQACAEEISIAPDGSIGQAEITSCGLNGGPLQGRGRYEARIACNLMSRRGGRFHSKPFGKNAAGCHPYFTQSGKDREGDGDQHIANFCNGATAGFKYFAISGLGRVGVTVCGEAQGTMQVRNALDGEIVAEIAIRPTGGKAETLFGDYKGAEGTQALYFTFVGSGSIRKFIDIVLE